MCTLIVLHKVVPDCYVVLAMNRDEQYGRPSSPWAAQGWLPRVYAPRDDTAGGTWIGINQGGVVCALSNRHGREQDPSLRSRGLLLREALDFTRAFLVRDFLIGEVKRRRYNPFNLITLDNEELWFCWYDEVFGSRLLSAGAHFEGNGDVDDPGDPKIARLKGLWKSADVSSQEAAVESLKKLMTEHGDPPLCLHMDGVGTVSSSILALKEWRPKESVLLYANGPPCRTKYENYSHILGPPLK